MAMIHEREPVREFTGDHHQLAINLMRRLEQQRASLVEQLAKAGVSGGFIKSLDDYRFHCGKIEGIDIAINLCKEAQSKLGA